MTDEGRLEMQARQGQALEFIVQDSIALAGYLPVPDDGLSEPNYQHVTSFPHEP